MKVASLLFLASTLLGATEAGGQPDFRREVNLLFSSLWKAAGKGNAVSVERLLSWDNFTESALIARTCLFVVVADEPIPAWREGLGTGEEMYSRYSSRVLSETKRLLKKLVTNKRIQHNFERKFLLGKIEKLAKGEWDVEVLFPVSCDKDVYRRSTFKVIRTKKGLKVRASSFLSELGYRAFLCRVFPEGHGLKLWGTGIGYSLSISCFNLYLMALDGEAAFCKRVLWLLAELDWYEGWLSYIPLWLQALPRQEPDLIGELRSFASDRKLFHCFLEMRVDLRMYVALFMCRLGLDQGLKLLLAREEIYEVADHYNFWDRYLPRAICFLLADPSKNKFKGKDGLTKLSRLVGKTTFEERFKRNASKLNLEELYREGEEIDVWEQICYLASGAGVRRSVDDYLKFFNSRLKKFYESKASKVVKITSKLKEGVELTPLLYVSQFKSLVDKKTLKEINYYPVVAKTGYSRRLYKILFDFCVWWENLTPSRSEEEFYRIRFWRYARKFGAPRIEYLSFAPQGLRERMVKPWRAWLAAQKLSEDP